MMPSLHRLALVAIAAFAALAPSIAEAQHTVIVLGIRSVEGDDEFTRNLTGALRHAASQVEGWNVTERDVTLAQMALAHGCDDPDPTCMAQVADTLDAARVIYGEVRRTSSGVNYDFSMNLHLFNGDTDQIERSVTDTIPGVRRDIDDLREPVRRYVAELSGAPRVGSLRISVNVPGAEVFIDDESVGTADEDGRLIVPNVQAGSRNVRIVATGHQSFRSTVSIEAYSEATFEAELVVGSSGGGEPFPVELVTGIGLLVVAAGLAAGWIASFAQVQALRDDGEFYAYREDAGAFVVETGMGDPAGVNACSFAQDADYTRRELWRSPQGGGPMVRGTTEQRANHARDWCNTADTFEILQFVFGIGAAAAGALGTYFLVSGLNRGGSSTEESIRLTPSIGFDHAYLGLHLQF